MRIKGTAKRFVVALAVVSALAGGTIAAAGAPAMAAESCSGDSCSGKNPATTGVGGVPCGNDARTVASTRVRVDYYEWGVGTRTEDVGFVELRWSGRCKTNWARFTAERPSYVSQVWATQDTGYREIKVTRGLVRNTNAGTFYTAMIYSPVRKVSARVVCIGSNPDGSCGWLNETAWV